MNKAVAALLRRFVNLHVKMVPSFVTAAINSKATDHEAERFKAMVSSWADELTQRGYAPSDLDAVPVAELDEFPALATIMRLCQSARASRLSRTKTSSSSAPVPPRDEREALRATWRTLAPRVAADVDGAKQARMERASVQRQGQEDPAQSEFGHAGTLARTDLIGGTESDDDRDASAHLG